MLPPPKHNIEAILGPTCVGKTSLSYERAAMLDAEIISVDSRQIYREITIGTAKPTARELEMVKHHFIDERSLNEPISAAEFAREAYQRIAEIRSRGKRVLLVGGSTLYAHALLFGLDEVPPSNPDVREALADRLVSDGLASLVEELCRVDVASAERIDKKNPRRVLRALEVFHTTGRPISEYQKGWSKAEQAVEFRIGDDDVSVFVIDRPRDHLYRRIEARVDAMYDAGLVDETKGVLEAGFSPTLQALQTIGYRETIRYVASEMSFDRMKELVKRNTRRYAKRQGAWLRRYVGFQRINAESEVKNATKGALKQ